MKSKSMNSALWVLFYNYVSGSIWQNLHYVVWVIEVCYLGPSQFEWLGGTELTRFWYSPTAALMREEKKVRLQLSTHSPLRLLRGQMARHTPQPWKKKERIQSRTTDSPPHLPLLLQHPLTSPPPHTPSLLPHSPFIIFSHSFFIFLSWFISDAFIHFQYLYVWVCLPPPLPPLHLPLYLLSSSPHFLSFSLPLPFFAPPILTSPSFPPSLLPYSLSPSFLSSLPPSYYCNLSLFHQPPCKQASWFP